ncbi:MAG: 5-carboxymethyl-2-hydroxymuconate Delta-isomerase [Gammaproteobacteria bacterium]|nr:5-carboxymethyl-2-hydroxymuconate Delta-isomerase [Gammaproteobacteria bacterium]
MPHLTVEYSQNLDASLDIKELVRVLHEAAADIEALPVGGLRTRAVARRYYQIADGHPDNAFLSLVLRLAPGRAFDVRKAIGETLFETLCKYLGPIYAATPLAISFEIQELDADLRWKQNNLRAYMAKRSGEE